VKSQIAELLLRDLTNEPDTHVLDTRNGRPRRDENRALVGRSRANYAELDDDADGPTSNPPSPNDSQAANTSHFPRRRLLRERQFLDRIPGVTISDATANNHVPLPSLVHGLTAIRGS